MTSLDAIKIALTNVFIAGVSVGILLGFFIPRLPVPRFIRFALIRRYRVKR
jgi:hypothetical protein